MSLLLSNIWCNQKGIWITDRISCMNKPYCWMKLGFKSRGDSWVRAICTVSEASQKVGWTLLTHWKGGVNHGTVASVTDVLYYTCICSPPIQQDCLTGKMASTGAAVNSFLKCDVAKFRKGMGRCLESKTVEDWSRIIMTWAEEHPATTSEPVIQVYISTYWSSG